MAVNVEKIPISIRLSLSLELAFVMFLCSAAVGGARTLRLPGSDTLSYAVALGVPAVAWLLLVLLACILPSLVAPGRLAFPLNFTLPIVFTALTFLVHGLVMRSGSTLTAPPDRLLPAVIWGQPGALLVALGAQIVSLSAFLMLANGSRRGAGLDRNDGRDLRD